jgi:hypothetical protein
MNVFLARLTQKATVSQIPLREIMSSTSRIDVNDDGE